MQHPGRVAGSEGWEEEEEEEEGVGIGMNERLLVYLHAAPWLINTTSVLQRQQLSANQ